MAIRASSLAQSSPVAVQVRDMESPERTLEEYNAHFQTRYSQQPQLVARHRAMEERLLAHARTDAYLYKLIDIGLSLQPGVGRPRISFALSDSTLRMQVQPTINAVAGVMAHCSEQVANGCAPSRSLAYLAQLSPRPTIYSDDGCFTFAPYEDTGLLLSAVRPIEADPENFFSGQHGSEGCVVHSPLRSRTKEEVLDDFMNLRPEFLALYEGDVLIRLHTLDADEPVTVAKIHGNDGAFVVGPDGESQNVHITHANGLSHAVLEGDSLPGIIVRSVPETAGWETSGLFRAPWSSDGLGGPSVGHSEEELRAAARQMAIENGAVAFAPIPSAEKLPQSVESITEPVIDLRDPDEPPVARASEPIPQLGHLEQTMAPLSGDQTDSTSDAERVLQLIGRERLLNGLPAGLAKEMELRRQGQLSDLNVAELAIAVRGVEILRHHKDHLQRFGGPHHWAGGDTAVHWVTEQGFSPDFAGFPNTALRAFEKVPGPPNLPSLHDFQREAVAEIRALVREGSGRGLLSFPTGAGKTRTATHALIEAMREGELVGPILWVAESAELCEQAASAWSTNWRQIGPNAELTICRFWGNNDVDDHHDDYQLVIATEAKLRTSLIDDSSKDWLAKANAIVIDEAHRGVAPTFTALLKRLGMDHRTERIPVIGLSATPYRNTDAERTEALVNRFGQRRFDGLGEDPYSNLQQRRILATVQQRTIDGVEINLSADERAKLDQMKTLPPSVLKRVGRDRDRNQAILQSILNNQSEDLPALLFAASVEHAELLAGLLSVEGIRARAITGKTSKGARRHYVEEFRRGDVKVLTNFAVLTEGFDAPAAKSVYIVRPTYSWNLYQQMIGRGLRGPLNGGSDLCTIVNVADNLSRFGLELAYREFEYLWS